MGSREHREALAFVEKNLGKWVFVPSDLHTSRGRPGVVLGSTAGGLISFGCGNFRSQATPRHVKLITQTEAMKKLEGFEAERKEWRRGVIKREIDEISDEYNAEFAGQIVKPSLLEYVTGKLLVAKGELTE